MTPLKSLAPLIAVLAAGALAAPALASPAPTPAGPAPAPAVWQDLRSPDARDAASPRRFDLRRTAPTSSLAGTSASVKRLIWRGHPFVASQPAHDDGGIDSVPLAAGLALLAAALAAGTGITLRRRAARTVA
jgi:hypothetical protein